MSQDYLLRQIETMTRALAHALFLRNLDDRPVFDESGNFSEGNFLFRRLKTMVNEGDINGAENLLFETIQGCPEDEYLKTALDFYEDLASLNDAQLSSCRFSRQEIADGLAEIQRIYLPAGTSNTPATPVDA